MTMRSRSMVLLAASMLAATLPLPGRAFTPPPPAPPCVPAQADVTAAALAATIASAASWQVVDCAVKDLAARGAAAMPVVLDMLRSDDDGILIAGLQAVARIGPDAQAALPILMAQVGQPPAGLNGLYRELYDALGAIGAAARPAIPLLLDRTGDPDHARHALRVLGQLGKHDSRVVPHLSAMLIDATATLDVLDALAMIGKDARGALPAVLGALDRAKLSDSREAAAALQALAAIGTPGESLPVLTGLLGHRVLGKAAVDAFPVLGRAGASAAPALIDKLQRSRGDAELANAIVRALAAIAPASPAVQRQLLAEATRHRSAHAAYALARIAPLPGDFAAPLAAALAGKPGDANLALALANARQAR